MDNVFHSLFEYAVIALGGFMTISMKMLLGKADKEEIARLEKIIKAQDDKIEALHEKIFSELATKEDVNKLERKLDKLIDREMERK